MIGSPIWKPNGQGFEFPCPESSQKADIESCDRADHDDGIFIARLKEEGAFETEHPAHRELHQGAGKPSDALEADHLL